MNKITTLILVTLISILVSCDNQNDLETDSSNSLKEVTSDTTTIKALTIEWNNCLVKQDTENLQNLYSNQVSIYGRSISKKQAIENKEDFFKKYPDFNQSITGDLSIISISDKKYKVSFPKRSSFNGKTSDVHAYLIFEKIGASWKIVNESDDLTDKNISKVTTGADNELEECIDIVTEILTTSPKYISKTKGLYEAVVKNGGTSYGIAIEGSPNPKKDEAWDFSETYDFNLHESYPDRMLVIARFTFNPTVRQLYEYDAANDNLKPISFNRNLLLKFNEICR